MAISKCPACSLTRFEMKTLEPEGSKFKLSAVQCASCGAVLGITDYYNVPSLLDKIAQKIGVQIFT